MSRVPEKCRGWKVANSALTSWWCNLVCGRITGGRLCEPWCRVVERYGLWTLLITIGLPLVIIVILLI
jgi:hypothetical protein